jgi:nitric oxide reductase NorQ protein
MTLDTFNIPEFLIPLECFVENVDDPARPEFPRLRALPDQFAAVKDAPSGVSAYIDCDWNCMGDRDIRKSNPLGTVFMMNKALIKQSAKALWVVSEVKSLVVVDIAYARSVIKMHKEKLEDYLYPSTSSVIPDDEDEVDPVFPKGFGPEAPSKEPEVTFINTLEKAHACPTIADDGFWIEPSKWMQFVRHVERRKNILIIGDSGLGKTEIVGLLAASFNLPVHIEDMGTIEDPMSSLVGNHRIGKSGVSEFDLADFVKRIQEPGIILTDEVNRASPATNNLTFSAFDRRRYLNLSSAPGDMARKIPVHPDCRFIATANIGSQYVGTNMIDPAFEDRFVMVEMIMPPQDVEVNLLIKRTEISRKEATLWVRAATKIRDKYANDVVGKTVSIRTSLEVAEMISDGFTIVEAMENILKPKFGVEYGEIADALQSL